ncbi:MAG: bifunctional folylpolyglutamate synthase/dihydrofolate synthase [Campylobacteraceae bacterium]|jgi:dihydrofolate synthase/folylpolyglutamate synthase|nr:bifunctional folylpolyglutamate synthase/dihydrofolate synthase [Campylobacteraceae bacterium]MBT4708599.1 bifunctional folylpolyglutamate synthase/dihydrofolate synthase [Campylobacteraceae bacterium]
MVLEDFLNSKPLYYDDIDFNNVNIAWEYLSSHIKLPFVIHIVGTNGKGSTGRYLSSFLTQSNFKTLHYSSPHILKFNERIWINGFDSTDDQLDNAHEKLQNILPQELIKKLTYFEYTTLVALCLSDKLDYLVLEAGLGGEFDATNIVENDLSLFTTIGLDHTEFLGTSIEEIASTKMRSCDNDFIIGKQVCKIEVDNVKNKVLLSKNEIVLNEDVVLPLTASSLPLYLQNNMRLALSALEYLKIDIIDFDVPILFGRCQKITSNITIDVGHNSLAASVLLREFINRKDHSGNKIDLIFNSYKDKDYTATLMILKPIINKVLIINIAQDSRIEDTDILKNTCSTLSLEYDDFNNIQKDINYLVFGSFKVVETFLENYRK